MFDRLKKFAERLSQLKPSFDGSVFNDPIADKTGWKPLVSGGANFRTRKLVQINPSRIECVSSLGMKLFIGAFAVPAFIFLFVAVFLIGFGNDMGSLLIFGLFAIVFLAASIGMWYYMIKPKVFERRSGYYWHGWKNPENVINKAAYKNCVQLNKIYALQILSEHVSGSDSSYTSYELNLVLKDAGRMNVLDHGDYKRLAQDAELLADFLNVPIWDVVQQRTRPKTEEADDKLLH